MTQDPLVFQLFNEIGIIDQLATTLFERIMPKGMTQAQFSVLNHFVRLEIAEKSPAALASAFQVTRPTMTSTLARLERSGLVSIRPDPSDGRGKLVSITQAGRAMRQRCIMQVAQLAPALAGIAPASEIEAILPTLRAIRIKLDAARDPSPAGTE
jgi:DNA-binding MarR family transcriptional regulator